MSDFSSAFYHTTSVIINSLLRKIQPFILKSRYTGVYVYKIVLYIKYINFYFLYYHQCITKYNLGLHVSSFQLSFISVS